MHAYRDPRPSPRLPRVCVGWAGRAARALTTLVSAAVLAVGALAVVPAPARAEDVITTQEYFSYYHLDTARAKGYTGKGVTIALFDGPVDTSAPELKGAKITDKSRCTIEASAATRSHGTSMASMLVSPTFGVAPDATLLTYQSSATEDISLGSCENMGGVRHNSISHLINQAIDDGAQIISLSQGSEATGDDIKWAIARAMNEGVIIVNSAGNAASDSNGGQLSRWSGVVGVAAITADGQRASYSSWGNGVTTAAFGGPVASRNYETGKIEETTGTSNSAALTSGMLALARQKWPDATANQILQVLTHTGLNPNHEWNPYTGYGAADLGALVNTDPSQYPDENPLAQKQGGSAPTAQEVQDYADGVVEPNPDTLSQSYVYRGLDEVAASMDDIGAVHLGTSPRYHRK
ncbi:S8/S53 family peptidase [Schaalia meyeri]|nr:S8 family serine peptidase [Schaalia meyeri]MCM3899762.1 S8/S53 family peptidase [Schaalia meyeri]